jgi:PTS system mannose-specific IIB component
VLVGWARALEADCLVVANDAVAADPMQRTLLPMAVPPHIKVAIWRVSEAADLVARSQMPGERREFDQKHSTILLGRSI